MTVERADTKFKQIQQKSPWSTYVELKKKSTSCGTSMGFDHSVDLSWHGFCQLIIAFLWIITHSLMRATFNIFTLVGWTYLMFTAWSNMSQQCFIEFRYGKYASRGKTVISWFSKNCWNFLALWAKKLLCTNKKISTKLFSGIWDHFLFQQELTWSGFDISSYI